MTRRFGRGLGAAAAVVLAASPLVVRPPAASAAPAASSVRGQEWWLDQLQLPTAWSSTKGAGVVVGLVDSGVDRSHPDLQGALVPGKDFTGHGAADGEAPVSNDPRSEHGTLMAGYIGGRGHGPGHQLGLIGAAPKAKIMSLSSGNAQLAAAIRYAADHGVKVINLSIDDQGSAAVQDALNDAEQRDVVVVAGSGNEGQTNGINRLAAYPGVVAVSGYVNDKDHNLDADSNFNGPETLTPSSDKASDYLGGVAVSAPYSTHDGKRDMIGTMPVSEGTYGYAGGTSNATAIVSGVVALIRSAHRDWNAGQVIDALIHTAYRPPDHEAYSRLHGFGIPNAAKAVAAPTPSVCENPLGSLVTNSAGIWPTIYNKKGNGLTYVPRCTSTSSPAPPSSPAPVSTGASEPATASPSTASAGSGSSSGGVPAWVWIVVAVVVVGGGAALLLARRGRGGPPPPAGPGTPTGPGGPGSWSGGWPQQPPPQQPPPGWQPPPPGWTPPHDPGR